MEPRGKMMILNFLNFVMKENQYFILFSIKKKILYEKIIILCYF